MSVEVNSIDALKEAISSGETTITSYDEDVVQKLKAIKLAKTWGPRAIAGIIAAIPIVIATGPIGAAALSAAVPSAGMATSTIIALVIAIGGAIAINLFTDWDYVEIGVNGIKMERKT
jgi:cytosine/adenosine deaminase-related metal-dependent hydrolase